VARFKLPGGWAPATDEDKAMWRHWMRNVFMPRNEETLAIIWEHAHLVDGDDLPPELQVLCAHIIAYKALLASWDDGDVEDFLPPILFPSAVRSALHETFLTLKNMQDQILTAKFWQVWLPKKPCKEQAAQLLTDSLRRRSEWMTEYGNRYFREAKDDHHKHISIFPDRDQWKPYEPPTDEVSTTELPAP